LSGQWEKIPVWAPSNGGLPYSAIKHYKVVGITGKTPEEISSMTFQPQLHAASGRDGLVGEPTTKALAQVRSHKIDVMKLGPKLDDEKIVVMLTEDIVVKSREAFNAANVCAIPGWHDTNYHLDYIRSLVHFQGFDRPFFGFTAIRTDYLEMVIYAELFDKDLGYMKGIPEFKNFWTYSGRKFMSICLFRFDIVLIPEHLRQRMRDKMLRKFVPDFMSFPDICLEIIGHKQNKLGTCGVLACCQHKSLDLYRGRLAHCPDYGFMYKHLTDESLNTINTDKFVLVDVEYLTYSSSDGASYMICPIAAITAINGKAIYKSKYYVDNSNCDLQPVTRICRAANLMARHQYSGQAIVGHDPVRINGGMEGLRTDVRALIKEGFVPVAKGARTEAIVLNDFGVTKPIYDRKTYGRPTLQGEDPIGEYYTVAPENVGSHLENVIRVYEMGGLKIERLMAFYDDRLDLDFWFDVYGSGYHTPVHHPLIETRVFSHHILSNQYHRHLYVPLDKVAKQAKFDQDYTIPRINSYQAVVYRENWSKTFET
jgi:hypothetical protein